MTRARAANQSDLAVGLRVGIERLMEDGHTYAEISIDDLVAEGGLAKSTFYVYFKDKAELLRVIAAGVMRDLLDFDSAFWLLDPATVTSDQIQESLSAMFDAYQAHGLLMAAVVDAAVYDPSMKQQFAVLMDGAVASAARYLRAGQAAGTMSNHVDPERTAFWLVWTLERGFSMLQGTEPKGRQERLGAFAGVIWRAQSGSRG